LNLKILSTPFLESTCVLSDMTVVNAWPTSKSNLFRIWILLKFALSESDEGLLWTLQSLILRFWCNLQSSLLNFSFSWLCQILFYSYSIWSNKVRHKKGDVWIVTFKNVAAMLINVNQSNKYKCENVLCNNQNKIKCDMCDLCLLKVKEKGKRESNTRIYPASPLNSMSYSSLHLREIVRYNLD
jgi:hypothetical protein